MPRAHLFTGTHVSVTLRIDGKLLEPVIKSVGQIEAQNGSLLIDSVADIALGFSVSPVFRSFAIAANAYLHPIALDAWLGVPGVIEVYVCHVTTRMRSPCHATVHPSSLHPRHVPPAPEVGSTHYTAYKILHANVPQPLILEADELYGVPSTFIFRYGDIPTLQNIANAHGVVFAGAQPAAANATDASGVAQNGNPTASALAPVTVQRADNNRGLQVVQNDTHLHLHRYGSLFSPPTATLASKSPPLALSAARMKGS